MELSLSFCFNDASVCQVVSQSRFVMSNVIQETADKIPKLQWLQFWTPSVYRDDCSFLFFLKKL